MSASMNCVIKDPLDEARQVAIEIKPDGTNGLMIRPHGYGCCTSEDAGPLYLEIHNGRLRLIVWGDINQEEATDIIDLEGAREDRRNHR